MSSVDNKEVVIEKALEDIQQLDTIESNLYSKLEAGIATKSMSAADQTQLVTQINDIATMRKNMYTTLDGMYSYYTSNISDVSSALKYQSTAVDIVAGGLKDNEVLTDGLETDSTNAKRMVELNTYYGQKYSNYSYILKVVFVFVLAALFFTVLSKMMILPQFLFIPIVCIIAIVGCIYVGKLMLDAYNRDNFDYLSYYWSNTSNLPVVDLTHPDGSGDTESVGGGVDCIGSACCINPADYDTTLHQCKSALPNAGVNSVASVYDAFQTM